MKVTDHYAALIGVGNSDSTENSRIALKKFLRSHELINKRTRKFVLKDHQTRTILGLADHKDGVYLVVADSQNLKS